MKPASVTARWSIVTLELPRLYVVPALAFASFVSRTKYGSFDSGPFVVIVCFGRSAFIFFASARERAASAAAPLCEARSAAQTIPAITEAMVHGDQPSCSSQRSCWVY